MTDLALNSHDRARLQEAERQARELVRGAEQYADQVLSQLESEIAKSLGIIRNGRQFLAQKRQRTLLRQGQPLPETQMAPYANSI